MVPGEAGVGCHMDSRLSPGKLRDSLASGRLFGVFLLVQANRRYPTPPFEDALEELGKQSTREVLPLDEAVHGARQKNTRQCRPCLE